MSGVVRKSNISIPSVEASGTAAKGPADPLTWLWCPLGKPFTAEIGDDAVGEGGFEALRRVAKSTALRLLSVRNVACLVPETSCGSPVSRNILGSIRATSGLSEGTQAHIIPT